MSEVVASVFALIAQDTQAAESRKDKARSTYREHVLSGVATRKTSRERSRGDEGSQHQPRESRLTWPP